MQVLNLKGSYIERRRREYPPVSDQLDAMVKLGLALRAQGIDLPDDVTAWLDKCEAVKLKHPKPD